MNIHTVSNPVWADPGHTHIACSVVFLNDDDTLSQPFSFLSSDADGEIGGQRIFDVALALGPGPYVAPAAVASAAPKPTLYGCAYGVTIQDYDFQGLGDASHIAAGMYLDVGSYLFFLDSEIADLRYYPQLWDGGTVFEILSKDAGSFSISAKTSSGSSIDPGAFNISIVRVS